MSKENQMIYKNYEERKNLLWEIFFNNKSLIESKRNERSWSEKEKKTLKMKEELKETSKLKSSVFDRSKNESEGKKKSF